MLQHEIITGYLILSLNWEGSWKIPVRTHGEFPFSQARLSKSLFSREVKTHESRGSFLFFPFSLFSQLEFQVFQGYRHFQDMPIKLLIDRINNSFWEVISQGNNHSLSPFILRDEESVKAVPFYCQQHHSLDWEGGAWRQPKFPTKGNQLSKLMAPSNILK